MAFGLQAIEIERASIELKSDDGPEPLPAELEAELAADADLRRAFELLRPGRKRSHVLYVSEARKSATRERRAAKCASRTVAGEGFDER